MTSDRPARASRERTPVGRPSNSIRTNGVAARGDAGRHTPRGLVVAGPRSPLRAIAWRAVRFCAFEVTADGRRALRAVVRQAPCLIVLDLALTDLPGLVVLERIRNLAPKTPVLVVARHPDLRSTIRAADLGVAGYLTNPVDVRSLLRRLRHLVGNAPHSSPLAPAPSPRALALGEAALTWLRAQNGAQQSVVALAATLGVSPRGLRRAVREAYGVSIKPLMTGIRRADIANAGGLVCAVGCGSPGRRNKLSTRELPRPIFTSSRQVLTNLLT